MLVYKYLSPDRTGFYKNNDGKIEPGFFPNYELVAQIPRDLNDPFECALSLEQLYSEEDLDRISKNKKKIVRKQSNDYNITLKNSYKLTNKTLIETKNPQKKEALKLNIYNGYIDGLNKKLRITSFSKNKNSILMWSHYAVNHKGFVIGLNINDPIAHKAQLLDVHYQDKLIEFAHNEEGDLKCGDKNVLTTKNKDWEYEEEIRLLSLPENIDKFHLVKFESSEISEIVLGIHFKDAAKNYIINHCLKDKENLKHVKIFQAKPSLTEYKIEFDEIAWAQ